ncbi:hypothetical protein BJV82DRAFT_626940 [Fennellomyces sp. T-0311]|nr:hypothetical protein BJV82DRAFT_626940 [Fennellomyces sp. T-0311]
MASLKDETTGRVYDLEPNVPFIVGRGKQIGLDHPQLSRNQLELNLLDDGRCFVKRLSSNPSLLRGKMLPMHHEIQVDDGDIIELLPNELPFKVCLETAAQDLYPPSTVQRGNPYYYDDSNMDEYQTQQQPSVFPSVDVDESGYETTGDEEQEDDSESDGWLSTESSLLGGEEWDDDQEKSRDNK